LGYGCEFVPRSESRSELFAIERGAQQVPLEREVLPDQSEAREKSLRALRVTKSAHAPLTFTRRLMAILRAIVHPGRSLDEHMFDVRQVGDVGLGCRVATKLIGDSLCARPMTSASS
jgi:hypothetical protein